MGTLIIRITELARPGLIIIIIMLFTIIKI